MQKINSHFMQILAVSGSASARDHGILHPTLLLGNKRENLNTNTFAVQ